MAWLENSTSSGNTSINSFLGLNMNNSGNTNLKLGESGKMVNFKITKDYKLEKMYGYKQYYNEGRKITAYWQGMNHGTEIAVIVTSTSIALKIGSSATVWNYSTENASIFEFNGRVYILGGERIRFFDTSLSTTTLYYGDYFAYVPKVKISCTPAGVGTDFENINLLTPQRKVSFSGDGESKNYVLPEKPDSIVSVSGTSISYTRSGATITFSSAPPQGTDNIVITYSKAITTNIQSYKRAQKYGLANDNRIFYYSNSQDKNRVYFSDLGDGVPDPMYIPSSNFLDVGSSSTAVTDISRQYDRLIISKENETYYANYESINDTTGASIISFPCYPLNDAHGMVAVGQGQLLDNYVTTIDSSIVQWTSTNTKDERNATIISEKIQEWLNEKDLSKSVTLDNQEDKEYWLAIDNEIMIYNYSNGCFSLLKIPHNVTTLFHYKTIKMGTSEGYVMEWDKSLSDYKGTTINAEWQSGYYDFGQEERKKTMRTLWIGLKPYTKSSLNINYITDRNAGAEDRYIETHCIDYAGIRYDNWTYNTQRSIKPFRVKLKAKKFAFLKLILKNSNKEKLLINSIAIKKTYGGEVK